jgi:hypothetical protein
MRNTSETIIDFYEGAYGHTIRIDVHSKSWLIKFRQSIARLSNNDTENIDISTMEDVQVLGVSSFNLSKTVKPVSPSIYSRIDQEGSISIFWLQDNQELITLTRLINSLIDYDKPGHQYLTNNEKELIVELAYKE